MAVHHSSTSATADRLRHGLLRVQDALGEPCCSHLPLLSRSIAAAGAAVVCFMSRSSSRPPFLAASLRLRMTGESQMPMGRAQLGVAGARDQEGAAPKVQLIAAASADPMIPAN